MLSDSDLAKLKDLSASAAPGSPQALGALNAIASLIEEYVELRGWLRTLLAPGLASRGVLRLDDWANWPEEQRCAYEALKRFVGE